MTELTGSRAETFLKGIIKLLKSYDPKNGSLVYEVSALDEPGSWRAVVTLIGSKNKSIEI